MNKILFCALIFATLYPYDSLAQRRVTRGIGTKNIEYKIDGQSVLEEDINDKTTGVVRVSYGRLSAQASFIEGKLNGPFSYQNIQGLVNKNGSFSMNDDAENWAEGKIICSSVDTFKSFARSLRSGARENFYKCISLNAFSYDSLLGAVSFKGGTEYPYFTEGAEVSFKPQANLIKSIDGKVFLPKELKAFFDSEGKHIDVGFMTQSDHKLSLGFNLKNNLLSRLNDLDNETISLKQLFSELSLNKISIPRVDGKDGVLFEGTLNIFDETISQNKLNVFDKIGQRLIEIKNNGTSFSFWAKYPETHNLFLEGEIIAPKVTDGYALIASLLGGKMSATLKNKKMALALSGMELKNVSFYDVDNKKLAEFNISFSKDISERDIAGIEKEPYFLDKFITGHISLLQTPQGKLDIIFNGEDTVTVNGVSGQGKNQADFYGLMSVLPKFLMPSLNIYESQMAAVLKEIVLVGDVYNSYMKKKEREEILNVAQKYAHTNYDYCVKELEAEKIAYMYECKGLPFNQISGLKSIPGVQISLALATEMGAEHSFIYYDKKFGRDVIMLRLQFDDENVCENVASSQKKTCENKEVTIGIKTELKTY